jgi:S1-C subfamily serine protease/tetratricopeptide (TPR) repeat protein
MKTPILAVALFLATNILLATQSPSSASAPTPSESPACGSNVPIADAIETEVKKIAVRIVSPDNGGSGVLIGKKGTTSYLVLTNKHVIGKEKDIKIETFDGKKYAAKVVRDPLTTDSKYDIALLEFTSKNKQYQVASIKAEITTLEKTRTIYAAGFPFDADEIRIATGQISIRPPSIPLDDGTQIPYEIDSRNSIREGMSGGPILVDDNNCGVVLIGINTTAAEPLNRVYRYIDGTSVNPSKADRYHQANWGIPIYSILAKLRPNILDEYKDSIRAKIEYPIAGDIRKKVQKQTVRIITTAGDGSGVIVAEDLKNNTYDVLTAKHVIFKQESNELKEDIKIITSRQRQYKIDSSSITQFPGVDLVMLKFPKKTDDRDEYEIAALGNYDDLKEKSIVFVGGFPVPTLIYSHLLQFHVEPGQIVSTERALFENDKLLYTNITYEQMSGGPVFDLEGRVLGIHDQLVVANSGGIPIQRFIEAASPEIKDRLKLERTKPKELNSTERKELFKQVKKNIFSPNEDNKDGKKWLEYAQNIFRVGQNSEEYSDAIKAFDKTVKILFRNDKRNTSDRADAYYGLAWSYEADRQYSQALIAIEEGLKLQPENKKILYKKFQILIGDGKYNDASSILKDLIDAQEEGTEKAYFQKVLLNVAFIMSKPKLEDAPLSPVTDATYNIENHIKYIIEGEKKWRLKQYKEAILDFDKAIELNPRAVYAYGHRGEAQSALKQYKEAILDFDKAIELNPQYGAAHLRRGQAKSALKQYEKAILDFKIARELFRKQGRIYLYREANNELKNAIDSFK